MNRNILKLRVVNADNISQSSFVLEFKDEKVADEFVQGFLYAALDCGAKLTTELLTYDMELNGVRLQKSS